MTTLERAVVRELQGDLPLLKRPYARIARRVGATEGEVRRVVSGLAERGLLRRVGGVLVHQNVGAVANAMVVWRVAEGRLDDAGRALAEHPRVSHCFSRRIRRGWPYNLYTMIHGRSEREIRALVRRLAATHDLREYDVLFSREEFKKTSPVYVESSRCSASHD